MEPPISQFLLTRSKSSKREPSTLLFFNIPTKQSHMLHGAGIFTYIYPKNMTLYNVGKYSSTMVRIWESFSTTWSPTNSCGKNIDDSAFCLSPPATAAPRDVPTFEGFHQVQGNRLRVKKKWTDGQPSDLFNVHNGCYPLNYPSIFRNLFFLFI